MLVLSCSGSFLEFGDVVSLGKGHGSGKWDCGCCFQRPGQVRGHCSSVLVSVSFFLDSWVTLSPRSVSRGG